MKYFRYKVPTENFSQRNFLSPNIFQTEIFKSNIFGRMCFGHRYCFVQFYKLDVNELKLTLWTIFTIFLYGYRLLGDPLPLADDVSCERSLVSAPNIYSCRQRRGEDFELPLGGN